MELLIALAMKFWQWSILIAVVIITFLINLMPKKKTKKKKTNGSVGGKADVHAHEEGKRNICSNNYNR